MIWRQSWRADPAARDLADRHYNRQTIGAQQFVPPGACAVFVAGDPVDALWITSAPRAEYVAHAWAGAWICTLYRNERPGRRSSDLIRDAIAATRDVLGDPPDLGMELTPDRMPAPAPPRPRTVPRTPQLRLGV